MKNRCKKILVSQFIYESFLITLGTTKLYTVYGCKSDKQNNLLMTMREEKEKRC